MSRPYHQRAGWRWLPRMASVAGGSHTGPLTVVSVSADGTPDAWTYEDPDGCPHLQRATGTPGWCADVWRNAAPDLDDPATQGAALAVLREARGCRLSVHVMPHAATVEWAREPQHSGSGLATYSTTANTLAAALLAALDRLIPE